MKNLCTARYITSELDGLQGEDLREKQARIQELLDAADLQQQAMEPRGEASGTRGENHIVVASQNKSHGKASSPNHGPVEHSRSNRAPGKSGGNHRTQHSGHHNRQPRVPATVTSKPRHPPRAEAAEPARGRSAAPDRPAQGAGCYSVMAPEKMVACSWRGSSKSLCVVNDQPVGNPKRKV
jgi:hypothetical protein